jgi:Ca2+-binding RTX toxin-like protein
VADTHGLLPEELAEWYYPSIGIHDWRALLANPEGDGSLPLEEAIAAGFLPPLPQLAANDYAALEPLYAAGHIELDTIELPEGLELEDVLAEVYETENTLTLAWGEGQVIHVTLAAPDDPVGTGIEVFRFVGGATMTLLEMLAWADPPPVPPILGTGDDDFLFGTPGSDRIRGLGGADDIAGAEGNDELGGDEDGDRLFGEAGNDKLIGGVGDDALVGGPGNDTLSGDLDRDFLEGGEGNDEYVFARGDGIDHIFDQEGADSVRFLEGIAPGDVAVTSDPHGTLHLVLTESSDRLILSGWLGDEEVRIEKVVFASGTTWDVTDIQDRITALPATGFGDVLTRTTSNDTVDGLGGNDEIYGYAGDDVLEGGAGDDYLEGDAGNDILRGGEGVDSTWDWQGNNLLEGGAGDDILVADGASSDPGGGSNFVVGGTGDDSIDSYASGNVIAFNAGDGHDTIYAVNALTLSLGNGIAPADLVLSQDGDDLLLSIGSVDSIRFTRQFEEDPRAWPQITLQMFGSVHLYDFSAVIAEFHEVLASGPLFEGFALGGVLQEHATSVSDTDALGGALAHQYGTMGNLNSFSDAAIRQTLANPNFGSAPQSIEVPISNQAPSVAVALLDQSVQEDSPFSFTIPSGTFSDPDADDVLTYSASLANDDPLPSWLKFDTGSRTFSGTPGAGDAGIFSVRVTATDLAGEVAIDGFEILVSGNAHGVHVTGTPDNDALTGTAHDDVLEGLEGRDRLAGLGGDDLLNGGRGRDRLFGGDGQDILFGDLARDTLYGGAGDDLLAGGRGNDRLRAGGGDDVYVYETHGGHDVIAETGGTDSLLFGEGITPGMARIQRRDNDLVVELSGQNGSLTVKGWFESGSKNVEAIRFSDGTTWDVKEIRDRARHNGNDGGGQIDDHGRHVRDRHDSPHDRSDTPEHDDGHSRRRAHQVADYLAALLAEKPRYDFEALAQEVEQSERHGEALSTREIARRWQRVAWYGLGSPNEQDDHARNGAASGFSGNGLLGGSAFGNNFGYAGSTGARRGAENLRTLDGLEEGFERLSL